MCQEALKGTMTRKGSIDVVAVSRNMNFFDLCRERIEESSYLKWHHLLGLLPRTDRGHRTCEAGQTQCSRRTILDRRRAEGLPEAARRYLCRQGRGGVLVQSSAVRTQRVRYREDGWASVLVGDVL